MPKELGDTLHATTIVVGETSDGNGSAGDAVEENGSGKVSPTDAAADDVYGIIAQDMSGVSDGDEIAVVIFGPVVANTGTSVTKGDIVVSGSTAGQLDQNTNGKELAIDEGGTTNHGIFAPGNPFALSDEAGTYDGHTFSANEAAVFMR